MTRTIPTIAEYFGSHTPWLWRWKESGRVVEWAGGETVAFREEIRIVLKRLGPGGLPDFGAIILLIAATRATWPEMTASRGFFRRTLGAIGKKYGDEAYFQSKLDGLDHLHELRDLVQSPYHLAELAATVFERDSQRLSPEVSSSFIEAIDDGLPPDALESHAGDDESVILYSLRALEAGLDALTRESLARRLATGLDEAILAAQIEFPPGDAVQVQLRELEEDRELGGVARLARLLLAATQLPRRLDDPEELPTGGVTDLTNRGPLDRLLPSELAHDDLTLATRVAMNEALYWRREPLRRPQPRVRKVLIDQGLRLWGIPRVFATAVAMSLAAQRDPNVAVHVYRAAGAEVEPVLFDRPDRLREHLGSLDASVHPGQALPAFARTETSHDGSTEWLLVTTPETFADPAFQVALAERKWPSLLLATVTRDGIFELWRVAGCGRRRIRAARFQLADILADQPSRRKSTLTRAGGVKNWPVFCRQSSPPLRFTVPVSLDNSWHVPHVGVITLARDGRLLLWQEAGRGASPIASGLPTDGRMFACHASPGAPEVCLVVGRLAAKGMNVVRWNPKTGALHVKPLRITIPQVRGVILHSQTVFVRGDTMIEALNSNTGESIASCKGFRFAAWTGRYFGVVPSRVGLDDWRAVSLEDGQIRCPRISVPGGAAPPLLAVVDVQGSWTGPQGVMATGEILSLETGNRSSVPGSQESVPYRLDAVSRDGRRVSLTPQDQDPHRPKFLRWDLVTGRGEWTKQGGLTALEQELFDLARPMEIHRHFRRILVTKAGELYLVSRRGQWCELAWDFHRQAIMLRPMRSTRESPSFEAAIPFESAETANELGYDLSMATFADGSRAVLDSRGLLHLQSADPAIPECSIVLTMGATTCWSADGRTCGNEYFLAPEAIPEAGEAMEAMFKSTVRAWIDHILS